MFPLMRASSEGDAEEVERLLVGGADVNINDSDGWTPAHWACQRGHTLVLKVLLEHNADITLQDSHGETPLHRACNGSVNLQLIDLLLKFNANVNSRDNKGVTPLHIFSAMKWDDSKVAFSEVVVRLLEKGANLNSQDDAGNTPAHIACKFGHTSKLKDLITHNVNINRQNCMGETPLHIACGHTYLYTYDKILEVVELLLKHNVDVNIQDIRLKTPLHTAIWREAAKVVERLLEGGASVNSQDSSGQTPAHLACRGRHTLVLEVLLEHGADINLQDTYGNTPLHYAFCGRGVDLQVIEKLLDKGACIVARNNHRATPYDLCYKNFAIKCALETHIVKLTTAGLHVGISVNTDSNELECIKAECVKEMDIIKVSKVNDLHYLNIVFLKVKNPWYLRNTDTKQKLQEKLSSDDFLNDFPLYGKMLRSSFEKATRRFDLLETAYVSFNSEKRKEIWSHKLPDVVKYKILDYLNNSDLKSLIESG